jgi:hypothetical protein
VCGGGGGGGGARNIGYYRYRRIKIFDIKDKGTIMDIVRTENVRVYTVLVPQKLKKL